MGKEVAIKALHCAGYLALLFLSWGVICFINATAILSLHDPGPEILWREGLEETYRQIRVLLPSEGDRPG